MLLQKKLRPDDSSIAVKANDYSNMSFQEKLRHQQHAQHISKQEKFNQELIKIQHRNNGKLF